MTFLLWVLLTSSSGATEPGQLDKRRLRAVEFEKKGAWFEACRAWDDILRKDRSNALARDGYQRCLRRLHLLVRHSDPLYRRTLTRLAPPDALDAYEEVLRVVHLGYPDRSRTSFGQLFRQGLQELQLALDDPLFRKQYLPGVKQAVLQAFKARLATWPTKRLATRTDARDEVLDLFTQASRDGLRLQPAMRSAMTMEFAAGACNTLDEHSSFMSPGNLALVQAALRGKVVGVGVEVGPDDEERLQITRIYDKSPAQEAALKVGDRVLRIGGGLVEALPADAAADRLRGEPGSAVEVKVGRLHPGGEEEKFTVKLIRRAVHIPSVEAVRLPSLEDGSPTGVPIGYLRINHFQDSTLHEVKEAIMGFRSSTEEVQGLILDLRGNPGGVFKSAVAVAELFVAAGVLVIGQSPFKEYNKPFRAEAGGPVQLPLVVLIDGETASAAEVLAVALQGARPGTKLVGQTTYGKGSVQCVIPVEKAPLDRLSGIRLTVAKLFSPANQPITGRGVTPDIVRPEKGEDLILEARKYLLELIKPGLPPMMPRGIVLNQPS